MRSFMALLVLFISSCGAVRPVADPRDSNIPPSGKKLHISVAHMAPSHWKVSYQFNRPIRAFIFWTDVQDRAKNWLIAESKELKWEQRNSRQNTLVAKDGGEFMAFTLDIKITALDEIGAPVVYFSDGSEAIFTSALNGYEYNPRDSKSGLFQFHPKFTFIPASGEQVTAAGASRSASIEYQEPPRSMGSYVYFGKIQPTVIDSVVYIVDPAVGTEAKEFILSTERQALVALRRTFGEVPFKPLVLLRHVPSPPTPNSAGGVAFWGSIMINLLGSGNNLNDTERDVIGNAVFHETVHFWNALYFQIRWMNGDKKPLFKNIPESIYDAWIGEGGAQAIALETRFELSIIDGSRYKSAKSQLLDQCKDVIGSHRVIDAGSYPSMIWAPYHCGELLQFLMVDLIAKRRPGYNIFDLWRDIFAVATDKQLDNDVIFDAVKRAYPMISGSQIDLLKTFLVTPTERLDGIVAQIKSI